MMRFREAGPVFYWDKARHGSNGVIEAAVVYRREENQFTGSTKSLVLVGFLVDGYFQDLERMSDVMGGDVHEWLELFKDDPAFFTMEASLKTITPLDRNPAVQHLSDIRAKVLLGY